MAITGSQRQDIIKKHARGNLDTGSVEVQVALITARINDLNTHFAKHKKDNHSRRGLLQLVSQRRSLLDYLKKSSLERYQNLVKELEIRK